MRLPVHLTFRKLPEAVRICGMPRSEFSTCRKSTSRGGWKRVTATQMSHTGAAEAESRLRAETMACRHNLLASPGHPRAQATSAPHTLLVAGRARFGSPTFDEARPQ